MRFHDEVARPITAALVAIIAKVPGIILRIFAQKYRAYSTPQRREPPEDADRPLLPALSRYYATIDTDCSGALPRTLTPCRPAIAAS